MNATTRTDATTGMAATLQLLRCPACGRLDTPPRSVCGGCLAGGLQTEEVPGTGTLASWTTIRRAPTRFRDEAPYDVVVVDLDAGPRVVGRLSADTAPAQIGARVTAVRAEGANAIFKVIEA